MQRLRRLGLVDDNDRFPELDDRFPAEVQKTLLASGGTRSVLRMWVDARNSRHPLPLTGQLVVLSHMREHPHEAANFLGPLWGDFAIALATCALDAGRLLHVAARQQFARYSMDLAVNAALDAQREFLFAVTSGRISSDDKTEALGKYAVAVALSARWSRASVHTLERAYRFQSKSIEGGNRAPEAYSYLVEILSELFNQTEEQRYLNEALGVAQSKGLQLAAAELIMKRGLLTAESNDGNAIGRISILGDVKPCELLRDANERKDAISDLQIAAELANTAGASNGVEHVQKALIQALAQQAVLGQRPLLARDVRLPYGFLSDLPSLPKEKSKDLTGIVVEALSPMRDDLRKDGAKPNLVAQQLLAAVYRESLDRSNFTSKADAERLVEATRDAAASRDDRHLRWQHADALLSGAITSKNPADVAVAIEACDELARAHPSWPLPRVTLARSLQLRDGLLGREDSSEADRAWADAISLVIGSEEFRRTDLGGRSGVFAVDDARGDLSTTLVFKPISSREIGTREAEQLVALSQAIVERELGDRFAVPISLGVFALSDGSHVHVIERRAGRLLSSFEAEDAAKFLDECAVLLAIYHQAIRQAEPGRSGWQPLKENLKLWCRSLFPGDGRATTFVESLKAALPLALPLVRKRDAHAGNWVVDSANRIVAIDFDSPVFLPAGHDLVQLVEDGALLPVNDAGFERRYSLFHAYLSEAGLSLEQTEVIYDWFAVYRAIWLGTWAAATKAQHSHARQLVRHVAAVRRNSPLGAAAETVSAAMRSVTRVDKLAQLTAGQRRISTSMSKVLRHSAVDAGLQPDDGGFVPLEDLAREIRQSVAVVLEIATHPAEPRFQVIDDRIRALYGHSFPVNDLHEVNVEMPETLFHGSSWDHLSQISMKGLLPRSRQRVHLTNNPAEAIEVARRHGHAVLLAVATSSVGSLQAVADAVWAAPEVDAASVRVLNAFEELPTPPDWLANVSSGRSPVEDGLPTTQQTPPDQHKRGGRGGT